LGLQRGAERKEGYRKK